MKTKEVIEKIDKYINELNNFKRLIDIKDRAIFARSLKVLAHIFDKNGKEMLEVFKQMKICLKNEAITYLHDLNNKEMEEGDNKNPLDTTSFSVKDIEERIERIKVIVDSLDTKIEELKKLEKGFAKHLDHINRYLSYLDEDGRYGVSKRIERCFKKTADSIMETLDILRTDTYKNNKVFTNLIIRSYTLKELDKEIVRETISLKKQQKPKYSWLNAFND